MDAEKILQVLFDLVEDQEKVKIKFTSERVCKNERS